MVPTTTLHEAEVARLADRLGLELVRGDGQAAPAPADQRYRLVATQTRCPVYPGGSTASAALADIEDWLGLPWE